MMKKEVEEFTCKCHPCKRAREKLKQLQNDTTALTYHMIPIIREILGKGNY